MEPFERSSTGFGPGSAVAAGDTKAIGIVSTIPNSSLRMAPPAPKLNEATLEQEKVAIVPRGWDGLPEAPGGAG